MPTLLLEPPTTVDPSAIAAPSAELEACPTEAPPELSKRTVVATVARRGGPRLIEASFIPALLFYGCLSWGGLGLAYAVGLAWTYGCLGRRLLRGREVPTVLVLAVIGITLRTALAVGSGSSFVYFAQPILGTVVTSAVLVGSIIVDRPLIGRLAHDFWPVTPDQAERPRVQSLFRGLTMLWAGVNLVTAAVTLALLLWLPLPAFVAVKQVAVTSVTVAAIAITITWAHRTACSEGIVSAPRRS